MINVLPKKTAFVLTAVLGILIPNPSSSSDLVEKFSHEKPEISKLIDTGSCSEAWLRLWHWAKKGVPEARASLWVATYINGIYPPMTFNDDSQRKRNFLILAVHSVVFKNERINNIVVQTIRDHRIFDPIRDEFLDCLNDEEKDRAQCVDIAVSGIRIPDFLEYSNSVDQILAEGYRPTECLAHK